MIGPRLAWDVIDTVRDARDTNRDPRDPIYPTTDPYHKFERRLVENLLPRRVSIQLGLCIVLSYRIEKVGGGGGWTIFICVYYIFLFSFLSPGYSEIILFLFLNLGKRLNFEYSAI